MSSLSSEEKHRRAGYGQDVEHFAGKTTANHHEVRPSLLKPRVFPANPSKKRKDGASVKKVCGFTDQEATRKAIHDVVRTCYSYRTGRNLHERTRRSAGGVYGTAGDCISPATQNCAARAADSCTEQLVHNAEDP